MRVDDIVPASLSAQKRDLRDICHSRSHTAQDIHDHPMSHLRVMSPKIREAFPDEVDCLQSRRIMTLRRCLYIVRSVLWQKALNSPSQALRE